MNGYTAVYLTPFLFLILFFISRTSLAKLFQISRLIFSNSSVRYILVSILFLPGTIVHELSHALMAMLLFLKVRDIQIFPKIEGSQIKLGTVHYEKRDRFRSLLVGIAPLIFNALILWWMYSLRLHEINSFSGKFILGYLIFVLSATMFSSKQDLVDAIYVLPLFVIAAGVIYVFQIDISKIFFVFQLEGVRKFLYAINSYLLVAFVINLLFIIASSLILRLFRFKS